jgi:hypothetical protein
MEVAVVVTVVEVAEVITAEVAVVASTAVRMEAGDLTAMRVDLAVQAPTVVAAAPVEDTRAAEVPVGCVVVQPRNLLPLTPGMPTAMRALTIHQPAFTRLDQAPTQTRAANRPKAQ